MIKKIMTLLLCTNLIGSVKADAIDDYVKAEMAQKGFPGFALAIMRHGQPVRIQGYGLANIEHSVPMHSDTLLKTGAVGMQFTAATVMLLVDEGKISLDDSVRKYLPEAPKSWQPVTIRQMLNHTSGLPATPNGDFRTDYTDAELLGIIYKEELNFPAGTRWRFSYVNYVALGFVIKRVTGEHYADVLTKRLFRPLGMNTAQPINELAIIPNRAAGYEFREGELLNAEWISRTANSTADGSLYLSLLDYAAWESAVARHALLKPESWSAIAQPARIASGQTYPYGFGWYQERSADQSVWRHAGTWQGFQTFVLRYLGDELAIVALANGDNANPGTMARHIASLLDPKFAQTPATPIEDREQARTAQVRKLLQDIVGGKVAYGDFTQFAKLDFTELMAVHQSVLSPLGSLQELALIDRTKLGDDQVYRYRVRYETGIMDVTLGYAPNGKIGNLDIVPVDGWQAPIQD